MRQEARIEGVNEPIGHYSDAVRFGNLLFVSGIGPLDDKRELIGGSDCAAQARQVFANMEKVLSGFDLGFPDVLKVTVFLTDVRDYRKFDQVRKEVFGQVRPASSAVGVAELALPGMKIEIEAIAGFPDRS